MNKFEWLNQYVLRNYFSRCEFSQSNCTYEYFEIDHTEINLYSPALFHGKIIYRDSRGDQHYSSVSIQVIEDEVEKSPFSDLSFFNEICMHTKIIPFFGSLNNSVYNIVPKFLYASSGFQNDHENTIIILKNLENGEFHKLANTKNAFLDVTHLSLLMQKIGQFHAFSYRAKEESPETFYSLVQCLKKEHFINMSDTFIYCKLLNEYFLPLIMEDRIHNEEVEIVRTILSDSKEFLKETLNTEGSTSVLNFGGVFPSGMLFKYDKTGNAPTDVRFPLFRFCKYCTPVVDIGFVLYILADQNTRDKYWDYLLDIYYTSLRNTFPESSTIPEKDLILNDFKCKSLYMFLFSILYMPYITEEAENPNLNWYPMLYTQQYEEYKYTNWFSIPVQIRADITIKLLRSKNSKSVHVLNILRDIIKRGFL